VDALAAQMVTLIQNGTGLSGHKAEPGVLHFPGFVVYHVGTEANQTFGSVAFGRFDFEVLVATSKKTPTELAVIELRPYVSTSGTRSIVQALDADRKLGGNASSLFFGTWTALLEMDIGNVECVGQRLPLRVWAG
jgi:hypothetical protein